MKRTYLWFGVAIVIGILLWNGWATESDPQPNPQTEQVEVAEQTPLTTGQPAPDDSSVFSTQLRWGSEPPAQPITGTTWAEPDIGVTFVYVPEGPFTMGSVDGQADEQPEHVVVLDAFWIMQTEVTNAQYRLCVEAGSCLEPFNEAWGAAEFAEYPVHVTWDQAVAYARWIGGRLPTEAQWEKAARGTDKRTYPWGNGAPDAQLLNYNRNVEATSPVGSYTAGASPYGVLDMAGNVWEWVADWYAIDIYATYAQSESVVENPTGPSDGSFHILRGGSWRTNAETTRTFSRFREPPYGDIDDVGVRVVRVDSTD